MGMAIGAGYVPGGIGLALLTRAVLSGMGTWELSHYGGRHEATVWLVFDPDQILANIPQAGCPTFGSCCAALLVFVLVLIISDLTSTFGFFRWRACSRNKA
jgi:hypothetical protein